MLHSFSLSWSSLRLHCSLPELHLKISNVQHTSLVAPSGYAYGSQTLRNLSSNNVKGGNKIFKTCSCGECCSLKTWKWKLEVGLFYLEIHAHTANFSNLLVIFRYVPPSVWNWQSFCFSSCHQICFSHLKAKAKIYCIFMEHHDGLSSSGWMNSAFL